jgi:hypothetical protein
MQRSTVTKKMLEIKVIRNTENEMLEVRKQIIRTKTSKETGRVVVSVAVLDSDAICTSSEYDTGSDAASMMWHIFRFHMEEKTSRYLRVSVNIFSYLCWTADKG